MRNHYEDTWFDARGLSRNDAGAGAGHSPYRWRPLSWKVQGKAYINERPVGVQQTAWTFVATSRAALAPPLRALFWFAPDDSSTAVRIPIYGGATRIPPSYGDRAGQQPGAAVAYAVEADAYKMSLDSAFWVANLVANLAYGDRYETVMPLVRAKIHEYQDVLFDAAEQMDRRANALADAGDVDAAVALVTEFGVERGEQMTRDWRAFWMQLFAHTRDGFTVTAPTLPTCAAGQTKQCTARPVPQAKATGYSQEWYSRIVADAANAAHYAVPAEQRRDEVVLAANRRKERVMDKQVRG